MYFSPKVLLLNILCVKSLNRKEHAQKNLENSPFLKVLKQILMINVLNETVIGENIPHQANLKSLIFIYSYLTMNHCLNIYIYYY